LTLTLTILKKYLLTSIVAFIFILISAKLYAQNPRYTYTSPVTAPVGVAVNIAPTRTNGSTTATSFAIAGTPALPAGLTFNTTTGIITGIPTTVATQNTYNITPINGAINGTTTQLRITISKGTITVTANNTNKQYGTALTSGSSSTGFSVTGLAPGATIASVILTYNTGANTGAPATANVNTYNNQIAPSGAVGGGAFNQANYNAFVYDNNKGDITVTPATLTVTADNQSRFQGAANPTLTATYTGFVNGEGVGVIGTLANVTTTATQTSPVGTYPITASGAADNNYIFIYVQGTLTVKLAPPSITYPSATFIVNTTVSIAPTNIGGPVVSYAINPVTLPAGLSFNTSTGVISGTPTATSTTTNYIVTATNTAGTSAPVVPITVNATGTNIYDWTGLISTDWTNPQNWQVNNVQQTTSYPGSVLNTDVARVGVNTAIPIITNSPLISTATIIIASLTFGNNNAPVNNTGGTLGLTVNGALTVSGTILQMHSNTGANTGTANGIVTTLQGSGTITCQTFQVGDNTLPANVATTITRVNIGSTTASTLNVIVNGNLIINSASNGFFIGLDLNNAYVSLGGGTLTVNGAIQLTNNITGFAFIGAVPSAKFSIDLNNVNTPVLNLAGTITSAANAFSTTANKIDFYNATVPSHKPGTVNYTGASQEVYNNGATGVQALIDNIGETAGDGYVYQNIGFSGSGTKTLDAGAFKVAGTFTSTTTGTETINLNSNNPTLTVGSNFSTGAGVTFTNGTNPVIIGGGFNNDGVTSFGTPMVTFNSTGAAAFTGTQPVTFNKVTFTGGGAKTITSGDFRIANTGVLTMAGTTTLDAGAGTGVPLSGFLTLNSGATGSASIDVIPAGCKINGQVNVQRYLSGKRSYRLLTSPVNSGTTTSTSVYSLNYVKNTVFLTGTNAAGGFDKTSSGPTLFLYKENYQGTNTAFTTSNFRDISDITAGIGAAPVYTVDGEPNPLPIPVGSGFLMYFRGDRAPGNLDQQTTAGFPATPATLTATGVLNQGSISYTDLFTQTSGLSSANPTAAINGFNLVGNPYASTIDLETLNAGGILAPGISNSIYELNPLNQNYGAYMVGSGLPATNGGSRYVASGQGFFVVGGGALTFNEAAKAATAQNTGPQLFMGKPNDLAAKAQYLHLDMAKDSVTNSDIIIGFKSTAKTSYDTKEDAIYRQGPASILFSSISSDNKQLAINQLPLAPKSQAIRLYVSGIGGTPYTLNMDTIKGIPAIYDVWLMDANKKDSLDMRKNKSYSFTTSASDTGSYGGYRFSIVLRQNPAMAYKLISFNATKTAKKDVQIDWVTQNEQNYTNFTVERSTNNGRTYNVVGGFPSTGAGTYSLVDNNPGDNNLYRLKQVDINDSVSYSKIVTVNFSNHGRDVACINVYPNPARERLTLSIDAKAPSYKIQITNAWGLILQQATSKDSEWQTNIGRLLPGTYYIQVLNDRDRSLIGQTKFVKL
jgi:hypothetical protein